MPRDQLLTSSSALRFALIWGIVSLFAYTTYEAEEPEPRAAPIHFAAGAHESTVPAQVYAEHIFVPVRVNNGETTWFVLDTGSSETVISKPLAEKIGLAFQWETGTGGVIRSMPVSTAKNVLLQLSAVEVLTNRVAIVDLSFMQQTLGRSVDGLLGYDVISHFVVQVDYEHHRVTFHDPATFVPDRGSAELAIALLRDVPQVATKLLLPGRAPIAVKCLIDSGAGSLILSPSFVGANRVLESVGKTMTVSDLHFGGESKEVAARIGWLQFGPYVLHQPVTVMPRDARGLLASPGVDGLIGGEILSRFTITFDYPNRRILFKPVGHFAEPFRADASGLSIRVKTAANGPVEIDNVEPDSAATTAGLQKGDVIRAIDGHPTSEFDLDKVRKMFQQSGRTIRLTVEREGKTLSVNLKLQARI